MRSRFAMLLGALLALALIGAAPVAASKKSGGTYLALGDSVPAGTQQPDLLTNNGFPNVLFDKLEKKYGFDELVNLACPGDDSNEMLDGDNGPETFVPGTEIVIAKGSICYSSNLSPLLPPGGTSQLANALDYISDNPGDVQLITLTIGANDIFLCGEADPPTCVQEKLGLWAINLGVLPLSGVDPDDWPIVPTGIIPRLRGAAGDDVPIVAMNYYSPNLALWLIEPERSQDDFISDELVFAAGGNAFIASVYGALDVPVVDVADAFSTFKTNGSVPKNVREVCKLTLMCEKQQGSYVLSDPVPGDDTSPDPDIHPSNEGHKVIAKAFDQLIRKQKLLG
ncbi:MAG: SGNH/GDSL hydrolase family protein [Acidimicrobiia bacterium]|nr:SGNH/GDSL hydrolase family protein [Acidimicrobiia bacterium]